MSRLAYETLPVEETEVSLIEAIIEATKSDSPKEDLKQLVRSVSRLGSGQANPVVRNLERIDFELIGGVSNEGTEAFLAHFKGDNEHQSFRVLAFRGTEKSFDDIKTDLRVNLVPAPDGGKIHAGFLNAYNAVEAELESLLQQEQHLPLYITGHSLGGALAMVATRYLDSDTLSATYTYGCPRVANDIFYAKVKTPIYRVINAGDGVPRIPFGFIIAALLAVIRLIPVNGTKAVSEWLRRRIYGYTHWGNVIFLSPRTEVAPGSSNTLGFSVKFSPDIFWRVNIVASRWISTMGKAVALDHKMNEYSQKLGDYAEWRNPESKGSPPTSS